MEIVTARLRLDDLRREDAEALFTYRSDPEVARWQGWQPASIAEAAGFIETQRPVVPDTHGTWWQRAIRLRDDGELIGDLGLHFLDDATVELGISLAPAQQRRGHAREAVEVMLDFVFGGLHKQRVIAATDPGNVACRRLLEGLGMRRIAPSPGEARDGDVVYALQAGDWLAPADADDHR
ncbi:MAG: GNAT family N-acetyltransferase [Proteobacteria bacterium]|nr:GNAT family N-acetyltransferase [Pseudomonadota bacterium]